MQVALRKKQYRFFLREAPKITKNKLLLHMLFGQVTTNQDKNSSIRTLDVSKLLYTRCSGISNNNKNPSARTLNISKLLYIVCSGKDAITLLLSRSTWNLIKSDFYTFSLSKQLQNKIKKIEQNSIHFEIATHRVLHERSSITTPFAEQLKIQK